MKGSKRALASLFCCAAILALLCAGARAQEAKPSGVVSGRVTNAEGKGAAGVPVLVYTQEFGARQRTVARATTDEEGRYTASDVPAGQYRVAPFAPASFTQGQADWPPGRAVNVSAGERVEDVNFTLARGGVITGRVTDPEGRPLVGQYVRLAPADPETPQAPPIFGRGATDDRGVYRVYGLPPGRYRLYVGDDGERTVAFATARRLFTRTYHPDAVEESQARVVEVTAGGEATDVDIRVASAAKTYRLAGRVVDAETGQPLSDLLVRHGPMMAGSQRLAGGFAATRTDARGEFRFETVLPGRYGAYAGADGEGDWYGDVSSFEVTDADVTGLELKVRRGVSVSGLVALEGTSDRSMTARVAALDLFASTETRDEAAPPSFSRLRVEPDGSFRVAGLRPGVVRFRIAGRPQQRGFSLVRIERGGVVVPGEGLEVAPGEQVTGVRLVFGYGTGVIRGRVVYEGGPPPADARTNVSVRRVGAEPVVFAGGNVEVDARGQFVLEGLMAGEYEVFVRVFRRGAGPPRTARQNVTVGQTGETQVTITLDPAQ